MTMRVAMVSEHASPLAVLGGEETGGQNVHVAALSSALAACGVEVVIYTRRDDPTLPDRVAMPSGPVVEHVDAGPPEPVPRDRLRPYMDAFSAALRRAWSAAPPDLVHAHFWMSGVASLAAARPLGIPVVQTFHALGVVKRRHQGDKDTSPPSRIREETGIARGADRIIATCSDEVFELVRLGASLRRISVVPCGVDLELFRPDGPAEPRHAPAASADDRSADPSQAGAGGGLAVASPDAPSRPRLVVVSRLVERKGIGNVITALATLPGVELVIAGGPPAGELDQDREARRLRALAEELGVAGRVDFRGRLPHEQLPPLLRSADAVVCVPWYEPFGIVPLEAMACGAPVVASAVGGLVDTVVDGVTGLHVPPRRPDLLAAALAELLGDPDRRAAFGRAGARRAARHYGWDRIAARSLDAYVQTTLQAPTRAPAVAARPRAPAWSRSSSGSRGPDGNRVRR
jgi:glycosyltransferase involved in cell wall biosynthesis